MAEERPREDFGCGRCWPASADAAWKARGGLRRAAELIDESHLHVMILACGHCGQRFVSVLTETIDWADGDDPQYWQLLPITETEASGLVQEGESLTEDKLDALGPDRRCLRRDYPKAGAPRVFWSAGLCAGLHD